MRLEGFQKTFFNQEKQQEPLTLETGKQTERSNYQAYKHRDYYT